MKRIDFETERQNVGAGWQPLIEQLNADLLAIDPDYKIDQIKEKFGGLRYYFTPSFNYLQGTPDDERFQRMNDLVHAAEQVSDVTCEDCGSPGVTVSDSGWLRTMCDQCAAEARAVRTSRAKP